MLHLVLLLRLAFASSATRVLSLNVGREPASGSVTGTPSSSFGSPIITSSSSSPTSHPSPVSSITGSVTGTTGSVTGITGSVTGSPSGTFGTPTSTSSSFSPTPLPPPVSNITVTLDYATYEGVSSGAMDRFMGMRFATATRFGLPQTPASTSGIQTVTNYGPACPQDPMVIPTVSSCPTSFAAEETVGLTTRDDPPEISEDCLFVNVIRPSGLGPSDKLPVVFWIYGGSLEIGDTSVNDGSSIVDTSIHLNESIIYVSANYRLNAFGFLGSQEMKAAGVGNLGLRDQRFAMMWIQKNIGLFGGDPNKVTLWGESAGAWSVGLHLFVNNGDQQGLFRSVFMESGSPIVLTDISNGQPYYDQLVDLTGCAPFSDTKACLTNLNFDVLQAAISQIATVASYQSLNLAWKPYVDGSFITQTPLGSISNGGMYAKVPIITGNCEDEGTVFSLEQGNVTTDDAAVAYLHSNYVPGAPDALFQPVAEFYTSVPSEGSPFGSGDNYTITPEYKRIAAVQGDLIFQAPRRYFLSVVSQTQNVWGYLYRRRKQDAPCLGSFHGSALPEWYGVPDQSTLQGATALINFINNGDPNVGKSLPITWLGYKTTNTSLGPPMLFFENTTDLEIGYDVYRAAGMEALAALFPFYV